MTQEFELEEVSADTLVIVGKAGLVLTITEMIKRNISLQKLIGAIYLDMELDYLSVHFYYSIPTYLRSALNEQFSNSKKAGLVLDSVQFNSFLANRNLGQASFNFKVIYYLLQYGGCCTVEEVISGNFQASDCAFIYDSNNHDADRPTKTRNYKAVKVDHTVMTRLYSELEQLMLERANANLNSLPVVWHK